jgi:Family of unknown function (DUF6544)
MPASSSARRAARRFSTTDRWYAGPHGLVHARWTTPIEGWITNGDRLLPSHGRAVWHLESGEFEYASGRFEPTTLEFNVPPSASRTARPIRLRVRLPPEAERGRAPRGSRASFLPSRAAS